MTRVSERNDLMLVTKSSPKCLKFGPTLALMMLGTKLMSTKLTKRDVLIARTEILKNNSQRVNILYNRSTQITRNKQFYANYLFLFCQIALCYI